LNGSDYIAAVAYFAAVNKLAGNDSAVAINQCSLIACFCGDFACILQLSIA